MREDDWIALVVRGLGRLTSTLIRMPITWVDLLFGNREVGEVLLKSLATNGGSSSSEA